MDRSSMAISMSEVEETLKKVIDKFSDTDNKPTNDQPVVEEEKSKNVEVEKTLKQVIEMISVADNLSDQLLKKNNAIYSFEVDCLIDLEGEIRDHFYDLIEPFYKNGDDDFNLYQLPLSQLQQEMQEAIRKTARYEMVALLWGLQEVRRNIFSLGERLIPLTEKMDMEVPLGVEMLLRNSFVNKKTGEEIFRPPSTPPPEKLLRVKKGNEVVFKRNVHGGVPLIMPAPEKCGPSTGKTIGGIKRNARWYEDIMRAAPKRSRLEPLDNAGDVAIHMYGFPATIGWDIKESMDYRKLIKNERHFDDDEDEIMSFLDYENDQENNPDIWVRVKMLKLRFKDLKKKTFGKKDVEPPRIMRDAARGTTAEVKVNRPGPEVVSATFRRALRNWVFHIEDVLFNFIISELYSMSVRNDRNAEAIFVEFGRKLKVLRETQQRRVPMTVYKTIYMLENPAMVIRTSPPVTGVGRENLEEILMEQIYSIVLRLMGILTTAELSFVDKIIMAEEEADMYEETLEQIEEEMREIERMINSRD